MRNKSEVAHWCHNL